MLLVDEDERVLLFRGIDRTRPDLSPWWYPVGGALDGDETVTQAAVRETREETGLVITDPGPVVGTRRFSWTFEGQELDQEESFFLVRTANFAPSSTDWTDTEAATIQQWRWWPVADLRATTDVVFPEDLADRLERLLAG